MKMNIRYKQVKQQKEILPSQSTRKAERKQANVFAECSYTLRMDICNNPLITALSPPFAPIIITKLTTRGKMRQSSMHFEVKGEEEGRHTSTFSQINTYGTARLLDPASS